ncbi:hypothetical protein ACHAXT_000847 [Thalassiosira profunda]
MSGGKVLESLVARGRRVRSFREQREISFGLADLSTKPDVHERIVKKGGVETLVNLLVTAQDAEAQQFAALAVANTASTKALCNDIIRLDSVVSGLVQYVGNEQADAIGRQYSALAVGNLLAEPGTHATIVEAGCIAALITMLRNCCDAKELESGKHAAFALSNVAFDRQYHRQIVEEGAIELLVALACCEDPDTQRQALAAVRGLCVTTENRRLVLQKGILDPLILMSRSGDVDIVQEVASAFNCLSSEDDNKEEISYRAISTLISFLLSGDGEIERHASCAIANLLEVTDIHARFLEERGVPPLIALCSSPDGPCRVEAARAVANLSSNPELMEGLIQEKALGPLVKSLEQDGDNCRFAALAIANFATHAPSLFKIVQAGAVPHLVSLVSGPSNNIEARRYGALAIANMTSCEAFHATLLDADAPEALFALSNTCDGLAQRYVGSALANLSSNLATHEPIVEVGGLQPIIALAYDGDHSVHKQAAAALRGFSATGNINLKIVQEGGMEPLSRLLLSDDEEVLRETTACLCNLSLGDENKFEMAKSGAVPPLISLTQSEDSTVAHNACECLANLAEMGDNQEFIAKEGAVEPCISAMRSRHIDVQRESGRLLANLAASKSRLVADEIISGDGHSLLTSFLLSQDAYTNRVGAFGIGNLCTHDHHRATLMKSGVLEPLTSLARSGKIELEIRRFAMLAIANLAACFDNHEDFVSQDTVPMLVSFSGSSDAEIRNYAAFAIAELSRNSDMMEIVTDEGGLEPVLYLARSDDKRVQRQVLPALTTLSFLNCNKATVCTNGALPPIVDCVSEQRNATQESRLACCAIANLVECASNMPLVVNHGCVPLLIGALESDSEAVQREAARAVGGLAVNVDYGDLVIKHGATKRLVACFQSRNCECQRMAALALANLSANLNSHAELFEHDILGLVRTECLASLDPKRFSDHETSRFCLLIISNLTGSKQNHSRMDSFYDILMDFTRHRDVKSRQYAVLALGNLCSNPEPRNVKRILAVKCTEAVVAFSFPPTTEDSVNSQFQAIAGLRGLSKHADLRLPLLRDGVKSEDSVRGSAVLEVLTLASQGANRWSCVEIQREAAATLSNLALAEANRILIAKSGALPALVNLARKPDAICQAHATTALANLAESGGEVHALMLSEECLEPLCQLPWEDSTHLDVKRAVSRCVALLASNADTHASLLRASVLDAMKLLATNTGDAHCERFGAFAIANLALVDANHSALLEAGCVDSLLPLIHSEDIETLRGVAFALHSFSLNEENHLALETTKAVESLVTLVRSGDRDTALQACLAVKYLCKCEQCRNAYVECQGLEPLLALAESQDLETKREVTATLRNISLSDQNKEAIVVEGGTDILALLCRDADDEVSHQACAVIATIAERQQNKAALVEQGLVQHLCHSVLSKAIPVLRESIRALANLSSAAENTLCIVSSGALGHLIDALESSDTLCRRFAAMSLSNLASHDEGKVRIVREQGVRPLMSLVRQVDKDHIDKETQQHAMACIASLAACHARHADLLDSECAELSEEYIKSADLDLRTNALLCLSNFASNKDTHAALRKISHQELIRNLGCNDRLVQLRAVTALRGLSTDPSFRDRIVADGGVEPLLAFVHLDDAELKMETLTTLCNLSLGGFMGDQADAVLQQVDMPSLISFLCNSDSTHRLFGAMAIGNIASHTSLQPPVIDSGALQPMIGLSEAADGESRRSIAYALCNLAAESPNRMSIILKGGLPSIMYLCRTGDAADMLAALSTLRGLAASADARRPIVEEGVLFMLSLAGESDSLECKREASALLVLLSINEENKFDVVRSDEMEDLVKLADTEDALCVSQMCRCVANISEVGELHSDVLAAFGVDRLARLCSPASDPLVAVEATRLCANLVANFDMHGSIVTPQLQKNLSTLCLSEDADIQRFSVLALANLCLNERTRPALNGSDLVSPALNGGELVSILHAVLVSDAPSDSTVDAFDKLVESKCSACMAISALCQDGTILQRIIDVGMVPALLGLLQMESADMNTHATFTLQKLAMLVSAHPELCSQQVALYVANQTHEANAHAATYSVAALRRLADCNSVWVEQIMSDAPQFMGRLSDFDNVERCREMAAAACHLALLERARSHIVESDALDQLFDLAQSADAETARFALGALANIASDVRFCDAVAEKAGAVRSLLSLTANANLAVAREATRALASVLSSTAALTTLLEADGVTALVNVSKLQDSEIVYNAAVAFRKMSSNVISHEVLFSQDGVGALVDLTSRDERNIQLQSAAALRDVASSPDFKLALAEAGGIRVAIELGSILDNDLQVLAFGIIRHLSIPVPLKRTLVDSGIVSIMSDCVKHTASEEKTEDVLYQIASSLANQAEHAHNKVALVRMGILPCLVSLCKRDSAPVKMETARAFALISSAPENARALDKKELLSSLIDLLRCQDDETTRDSAAAISNVSTNPEINALFGSLGAISPLVQLLSSSNESCQINACRALCRLTALEENVVASCSRGAVVPLRQLCSSQNDEVALVSSAVLCNLSTCSDYQMAFVHDDCVPTLKQLLASDCPLTRKNATMILCNLTSHADVQDHVVRQVDLLQLFQLMSDASGDSSECRIYATCVLANIASKPEHGAAIMDAGGLQPLVALLDADNCEAEEEERPLALQRASILAIYNLSASEGSHALFVKNGVLPSTIALCGSRDVLCRRFALMVLANVACNDQTRADATKGGGLQAAVHSLKDDDLTTRRFASLCLANLSNDSLTQTQAVVHGGLPRLLELFRVEDEETQECALLCLSNLAANEGNHAPLMKQGAFKAFVQASRGNNGQALSHVKELSRFALANMCSGPEHLTQLGKGGCIKALVALSDASEDNLHARCLALASLRRLAIVRENRDRLIAAGVLDALKKCFQTEQSEVLREVASCACNLSLSPNHRLDIARATTSELVALTNNGDNETTRLALGALANLAEDIDTHPFMTTESALDSILVSLNHEVDVKREAARAVANLLSSREIHTHVIRHGLDSLIDLSAHACEECRYLTALSFRKLAPTKRSHQPLINNGLENILALALKVQDVNTKKQAATALRDLSVSGKDSALFFPKVPAACVELLRENERELQFLAVATLRHLSVNEAITSDFSRSGIMQSIVRLVSKANEDMRCQMAGLFANLSEHLVECHSSMVSNGAVKAIDTLLAIEHEDISQDCSRALANLCANESIQSNIHRQGGLTILAKLGNAKGEVCQRYVAIAMRFMSSSVEVQKSLASGNEPFPFIEFSGSNLLDYQRAAAAAFASMSLNQTGRSLVLRKGGIKPVLQLCIHLDLTVRRDAVFATANLASSPDLRQYVVKEGGIETIKAAAATNQDVELLRDAARAMSSFSIDVATKELMISAEVPKVLCRLVKSSDSATQRFASLAICNLCWGTREQKELVAKQGTLRVLLFLMRYPDLEVERCASLALASLALGSDSNKQQVVDLDLVKPAREMSLYPDARLRQSALLALNGIALGERPEAKNAVSQNDGLASLLALLASEDEETGHTALYLLGTLMESTETRDASIESGCLPLIIEKAQTGPVEAKRAAAFLLSLLAESPKYHDGLRVAGGLESVVRLASLVDEETRDYAAMALAYLANNKSFQVPLTKMGVVRPLVALVEEGGGGAGEGGEAKHYAGLALLKLADSFETHATLAEEGGVSALLKLGRGRTNSSYRASLSVSKLAKNAASQL